MKITHQITLPVPITSLWKKISQTEDYSHWNPWFKFPGPAAQKLGDFCVIQIRQAGSWKKVRAQLSARVENKYYSWSLVSVWGKWWWQAEFVIRIQAGTESTLVAEAYVYGWKTRLGGASYKSEVSRVLEKFIAEIGRSYT